MMSGDFNALMTHNVSLIQETKDKTGSLSDGTTYSEKGFVEYTKKRTLNERGETIHLRAIIYLKANSNFDETHPTWSITHNSERFKVETVERIDDPRTGNTHHWELGVI